MVLSGRGTEPRERHSQVLKPSGTKLVGEDDPVEAVRVGDADGLWIPAGHVLLGANGTPTAADRVLLWVSGGTEYRLETNLDKPDAVALATQVEGTPTG